MNGMSDYRSEGQEIQVVIILPYLNEQDLLLETCQSLGFGSEISKTPRQTLLVLVDNGSIDRSPQIAEKIKENSTWASVITDFEPEQGHIPPRRRGNLVARQHAETNGWRESDVLILQADADVIYPDNYVESMRAAASAAGENTLIESFMSYPEDFLEIHRTYFELWLQAEQPIEKLFASEADDCLVVDCVAGYRLKDYFNWGGHQQEYNGNGDEIYAETSRLYLKAKANSASRYRVEDVICRHSARKIILDPAYQFATAGFPRENTWNELWHRNYRGPTKLPEFYLNSSHPGVTESILYCQKHLLALLSILPFHVNTSLNKSPFIESEKLSAFLLSNLPQRSITDLRTNPGLFFSDILELIDVSGNELLRLL